MQELLLETIDLTKDFSIGRGLFHRPLTLRAVDGLSFSVRRGETLGLVGETGCGKSTTGLCVVRLIEPTSGIVKLNGVDITSLDRKDMRKMRREMQVIFQDPFASLNPRMTVFEILAEPLSTHGVCSKAERMEFVNELLEKVGLTSYHMFRYPHQFSGGQRQRIAIARALAVKPTFVVADEPVSALDISIQSQILNLLQDLQDDLDLTYLLISHNLNVVQHICTRVAVMYLGQIVEISSTEELFQDPQHPYTESLLSAVPVADPHLSRKRIILKGDVPTPINPPSGCHFRTRCPYVFDRCVKEEPALVNVGKDHLAACHLRG